MSKSDDVAVQLSIDELREVIEMANSDPNSGLEMKLGLRLHFDIKVLRERPGPIDREDLGRGIVMPHAGLGNRDGDEPAYRAFGLTDDEITDRLMGSPSSECT